MKQRRTRDIEKRKKKKERKTGVGKRERKNPVIVYSGFIFNLC